MGIYAATRATRFEALERLRPGARRCFGAFVAGAANGLIVRHDYGSVKMLEEQVLWARAFRTVEELRLTLCAWDRPL